MASIHRQKKRPYWFCSFFDGEGKQRFRSTGTADKSKAKTICDAWGKAAKEARTGILTEARARKLVEDTVADIFDGTGGTYNRQTVREFFDGWLAEKDGKVAAGTFRRYDEVVRGFLGALGKRSAVPIAQLSVDDVQRFHRALLKTKAGSTANLYLKVVAVILNRAFKLGLIDRNPAHLVDRATTAEAKRRPFTLPEIKAMLAVANDDWRLMILLGLYTGQRLTDLSNLTWQNVDIAAGTITFPTRKTGRTVDIPMAAPLREAVEALPACDDPAQPLFPDLAGKESRTLSGQFRRVLEAAGLVTKRDHGAHKAGRSTKRDLESLSFHCLRHTATTLLKAAGVSDVIARDVIGHDSEVVSRNYTHLDGETKRQALDKLPDVTR